MLSKKIFLIIFILLISTGCSSLQNSDCKENTEVFFEEGIHTYYKKCLRNMEMDLNNQKVNIIDFIKAEHSIKQIVEQM